MSLLLLLKSSAAGPATQGLTQSARFDSVNSVYLPSVARGAVTLSPTLFTSSNVFYSATVSALGGVQTLTSPLLTNTNTFYPVTLVATYALIPARINNTNSVFVPTVHATYSLTASRFNNTQTIYAPSISQTAPVQSLTQTISFTNNSEVYLPTLTTGTTYVLKYWNGAIWEVLYKDPVIYG
jgi:hypothetical protein